MLPVPLVELWTKLALFAGSNQLNERPIFAHMRHSSSPPPLPRVPELTDERCCRSLSFLLRLSMTSVREINDELFFVRLVFGAFRFLPSRSVLLLLLSKKGPRAASNASWWLGASPAALTPPVPTAMVCSVAATDGRRGPAYHGREVVGATTVEVFESERWPALLLGVFKTVSRTPDE